jgi:ABC-type multidrug transport system fused ATPase/permease subunit
MCAYDTGTALSHGKQWPQARRPAPATPTPLPPPLHTHTHAHTRSHTQTRQHQAKQAEKEAAKAAKRAAQKEKRAEKAAAKAEKHGASGGGAGSGDDVASDQEHGGGGELRSPGSSSSAAAAAANGLHKSLSQVSIRSSTKGESAGGAAEADADHGRSTTGVLASHPQSRDIQIDSFTLLYHGHELLADTKLELNFGRRYGLLGLNGCGKSTMLKVCGVVCWLGGGAWVAN